MRRIPTVSRGLRRSNATFTKWGQIKAYDTSNSIAHARANITAYARYFKYFGGFTDNVNWAVILVQNRYFALAEFLPHPIPWMLTLTENKFI